MHVRRPWLLLLCVLLPVGAGPARAQPVRTRVLQSLGIERRDDEWELLVRFNAPVRYLRHSPEKRGQLLEIDLELIGEEAAAIERAPQEALRPERGTPIPLDQVVLEGHRLEVRFKRPVSFQVRQGRDFRSLSILLPLEAGAADQAAQWMAEARQAMTAGEHQRAILIFTKVLELPESPQTREARELLGVAYERAGQLAHARAEYAAYLDRYPEGEGAQRVRQRLKALLTAREEPSEPLRAPREKGERSRFDVFGSLSTAYVRTERFGQDLDGSIVDQLQFVDLFTSVRGETPSLEGRAELAGSFRYDYDQAAAADQTRISSLFVELGQRDQGFFGSLGRQTRSRGGVLGRFDGGVLGYRVGDRWEASLVGGFPRDTGELDKLDAQPWMLGGSVDFYRLVDAIDLELFGITQQVEGLTDRAAVGGEARLLEDWGSAIAFVDYDVYYASLNDALLVGNWRVLPSWDLNVLAEYRNVPFLTTQNALIGQRANDIGELQQSFSDSDITSLAEDRTAKQANFTLGSTLRATERVQLSGDVSLSRLLSTPTSGGVTGFSGTSWEPSYYGQVSVSDWLGRGDINTFGVRYFAGDSLDLLSLRFDARYPLIATLRFNPQLLVDWQHPHDGDDLVRVAPRLRFDWGIGGFYFDVDVGADYLTRPGGNLGDEWGYLLDVSLRYDF